MAEHKNGARRLSSNQTVTQEETSPIYIPPSSGILVFPSALPIEPFGHVVYSWVCKHPDLCARSRRTSGLPWRPGSGRRPPLRYAAARSSSPVPRGSRPPPLHATCTVPTRPCATPFMPCTSVASPCSSRNRRGHTPRLRSWTLASASPSGRCCTRVPGRLASPQAGGRSPWLPRSASPRGSPRGSSATKPFASPCADWGWRGNAPHTGSPAPIRPMPEKKTARPGDPAGDGPSNLGAGLWR